MADIEEVKIRLRRKYLGQAGIHGFGIRRVQNAICVYLSAIGKEQQAVLAQIEEEAAPYPVVSIQEQPPSRADRSEAPP